MLELMSSINSYLLGKLPSVASAIHEDFFPGDEADEVMCRHDPSPVIKKRFLTGAYRAEFGFSYYATSSNVIKARQTLEAIMDVLIPIENFRGLFGLTEGRLEVVARPTPVQELDAGAKIYTSSFRLVYFQEV